MTTISPASPIFENLNFSSYNIYMKYMYYKHVTKKKEIVSVYV